MATMCQLAEADKEPRVVNDQRGRPTSAEDLAKGIRHLLANEAEYGVYNITSDGDSVGRDEIAMAVFIGMGKDPAQVHPVTSKEYGDKAPRPAESTLALDKIKATGFAPMNWRAALALYLG